MKRSIVLWVEKYFYDPTVLQRAVSFALWPASLLYCFIVYMKYRLAVPKEPGIKVVSVGNLTVGGSGKTPLVSAIAKRYDNVAVVLRGYGRKSKGLIVVKNKEELLCDVERCGDEAMVYAKKLTASVVIVSEERSAGIQKAKELGASFVILDDGYSKHHIKKFDILIHVHSKNGFCLPAGPFRERLWSHEELLEVYEERDFKRRVVIRDATPKMVLVTAIARPQRLDRFLPCGVVAKEYFEDHYEFQKEDIQRIFEKYRPDSLLVTLKDYVKLEHFGYPLSLMDLELDVDERVYSAIENYISK